MAGDDVSSSSRRSREDQQEVDAEVRDTEARQLLDGLHDRQRSLEKRETRLADRQHEADVRDADLESRSRKLDDQERLLRRHHSRLGARERQLAAREAKLHDQEVQMVQALSNIDERRLQQDERDRAADQREIDDSLLE
ncbi:hypothetical protein AB0C12_11870 [Actinoplanes sp. NPDC048967]|uniref:hypothetical protein n=1 Tax=Actinoplanes sp. NPDC048967 TaxID=3155269 RepID=UPI0033DD94CB